MSISGTWYNELGSQMEITTNPDGSLSGTYYSAVGQAQYQYTLSGRYDAAPSSGGQSVGWTVAWLNQYGNAHSTTSWTGQYQIDPATGQEEIYTFWLLVAEMPSQQDWSATNVGQDTFTRAQPDAKTIERARRLRRIPHPVAKK
jgi:hypothetical protein